MRVDLAVDNKPYAITFDENNFTILNLAEKFCRDLAGELSLRSMENLVFGCISPIGKELRRQISMSMDSTKILQGNMSAESTEWLARSIAAAKRQNEAAVAAPAPARTTPVTPAQFPTDFKVKVNAGDKAFVIVIDLNSFTLTEAAEQFCREHRAHIGVTSYDTLANDCIPQVSFLEIGHDHA
jgi:hypothetical protein